MSKTKKGLLIVAIIFIAIQFYRPNKNIQKAPAYSDFLFTEKPPEAVASLITNSCYDCHSNYTNYLWYDHIAPATWFVDGHIKNAKEKLNFSNWTNYDIRDKRGFLSEMLINIEENKMPLPSYLLLHKNAKLSDTEKKQIEDWLYSIDIK